MDCCLCGGSIDVQHFPNGNVWFNGCNAQPVKEGRCCIGCFEDAVCNARIIAFDVGMVTYDGKKIPVDKHEIKRQALLSEGEELDCECHIIIRPGDEYVDWIGVGTLNYGTVASWSKWWTFKDIYGNYYDWLDMLDKPMMITEMGCLRVGGNREEWFRNALTDLPAKYPRLKAIILFNDDDDKTTLNKSLNWSIINDTSTCEVIRQTIKDTW